MIEKEFQKDLDKLFSKYRKLFPEIIGMNIAFFLIENLKNKEELEYFNKEYKNSFDKIMNNVIH